MEFKIKGKRTWTAEGRARRASIAGIVPYIIVTHILRAILPIVPTTWSALPISRNIRRQIQAAPARVRVIGFTRVVVHAIPATRKYPVLTWGCKKAALELKLALREKLVFSRGLGKVITAALSTIE
jgi:hypothetical protein